LEFSLFDLLMAVTVAGYVAFVLGMVAGVHYEWTSASQIVVDAASTILAEATLVAAVSNL